MDYWKILGGAAIGVGAVAAAPFTGGGSVLGAATLLGSLAGGATIAGAGAAAVAGGIAVAALSDDDDNKEETIKREATKKAKAEAAVETEKYKEKLEQYDELLNRTFVKLQETSETLKKYGTFFDGLLALEAVGLAAANCDGVICNDEQDAIDYFIKGINKAQLPESYKKKAVALRNTPPSIEEAFELARNSDVPIDLFKDIIAVVIYADEVVHENEAAFLEKWSKLEGQSTLITQGDQE
jgi:hypothetical protein